ncbi:MAG TPA: OsmC family protein [Tepidisphaeraceae bacterium]|nr:OsmC family protein [Tepidisphaeraceae bacterium]
MQATQATINGVNVPRLLETIDVIRSDGSLADFTFRVSDHWLTCGHNRFTVQPFHGANQQHDRPDMFTFEVDEPPILLGTDKGPNPVEYTLGSLLGCLTNTLAYHAASRGIEIEHMESKVEGDIDIHGFLGLDPNVRCGYQEIRVKFRIKSDADPELLKKLAKYSPVYDTISNPVRVIVDIEKV